MLYGGYPIHTRIVPNNKMNLFVIEEEKKSLTLIIGNTQHPTTPKRTPHIIDI